MGKKAIIAIACLYLLVLGIGAGYVAGQGIGDFVGSRVTAEKQSAPAVIQTAVPAETKDGGVKMSASPNAKCDICGSEVPEAQLTKLNCGEHRVCSACVDAEGKEYLKHTDTLPCGAYECDGRDHYREPINCYCPEEPQHYACECGEVEHVCPACGETYPCEESNHHAICIYCGKAWCTNNGRHGFCTHCGSHRCDGGDHDKCTVPGCPYYNCESHCHCPICYGIVSSELNHLCMEDGCTEFTCTGHVHGIVLPG